ncbi:MAG: hypothetical protein CL723_03075 [Chloroflexi bacterium]|jgi:MFS family permease|nr:hypothetical protein [Chloroflexota bacterium]|tara:strand:+ start:728 stop:1984 length:1257 start_codon:yes stop_codon:yes gene_type:complete
MSFKIYYDQSKESSPMYYGWILALFGNLVIGLMTVSNFQGTGFFLKAFERQKGWGRAVISGASSFARAESALLGPIEGYLLDRFGVRRIMVIGNVVTFVGFLFIAYTEHLYQLYIGYFFISFGSALAGWLPTMTLMNLWFEKKKTFAMAFSITGTHIAGWVAPFLAYSLLTYGIKNTALVIAVTTLMFSPLSYLIVRDRKMANVSKDSEEKKQKKRFGFKFNLNPEIKYQLKRRPFWIIAFTHMCSTTSIVTLTVHLPAYITDLGFTTIQSGYIVSIFSTVAIFSQYIAGYTGDKYGKKFVLLIFLLFQVISLIFLALSDSWSSLIVFAIFWGIGYGGRTPLMTAIRGDYFDRSAFATLFGLSGMVMNVGTTSGPILAGWIFDSYGSYTIALWGLTVIAFCGCLLLLILPPASKRIKS